MRLLVIAAHPDDEVLLAGGTMAKYGGTSFILGQGRETTTDQRFDAVALLNWVTQIEEAIDREQPDTIITHHYADVNKDHRIIYEAVMAAARPVRYRGAIWLGEVPGSTDWWHERFTPNLYVELTTEQVAQKCDAMDAYGGEVRDWPHPRSRVAIINRSLEHGATVMGEYAEAFQVVREIR